MLSIEDNHLLTRAGPATPMGQLVRRFWVPVLLSRELPEPDCPPKRLTVMGEDLLAFRDTDGRVGLIDPVCPHRGANLYYGRNEAHGIRCVFHGLKFDVHGACVDIPIAPPGTDRERLRIKAYPAREAGGLVWAYMGPEPVAPAPPALEFTLLPESHRYVSKKWQACNWVQCVEGALDTAHFSFLHMVIAEDEAKALAMLKHAAIGAQSVQNDRVRWVRDDPMPSFEVNPNDVGLTIGGARRADEDLYWRIAQFMVPNHALAPSAFPGELMHGQTWVPVSDDACWIYTYTWHPDRPLTEREREMCESGHTVHAKVDEHFRPLAGPHNDYMLDREEQKHRSFTGIAGVSEQDAAIQDSQGPIADRTRERLFSTDVGIVKYRRLMLGLAKELQEGREPAASRLGHRYALRSGGWVAQRGIPLETVMQERFGDPQGYVGRHYGLE
ncbi:Phthalate 4,5-dioxygenase oxygenase subunit [Pigmentiphaga humi]|uniref:Phthalate 4,5-dioxygenase oxygenase subunit n=1 Tax=Pigmentiphaga humi TaxID=2478468 RepID=A0A3P4B628_9BURK|nr:Rieske 2Fe-2S domain-containing protein [Pigmentiphaga humi]VCU71764.1 Phthalate 4,5-dioxygenase oxygenase subunit [Pigmentiphaga humi]